MVILTMLAVLVVALAALAAVAAMHFALARQQVRTPGRLVQLETAARLARQEMNRAAGQSWRNIVD